MVAIALKHTKNKAFQTAVKEKKSITWAAFQQRYLLREDGYTYEWVNGQVEKTKRSMDFSQMFIVQNLTNLFIKLVQQNKVKSLLTR